MRSRTTRCSCVQTGALLADTNRFKFDGTEHYLKSASEMRHLFRDVPDACDNTLLIAERADVQIELGKPSLPEFPVPDRFTGDTYEARALAYLRDLTMEGARRALRGPGAERGASSGSTSSSPSSATWDSPPTSSSCGTSSASPGRTASGWARAGARRPAVAWPTACGSSTSTPSATTSFSSASSTRAANRCPTSTWTSTSATGPTSCATPRRSTAATGWRRSSPSPRSRPGRPCATRHGCSASPTSWGIGSPRPCRH